MKIVFCGLNLEDKTAFEKMFQEHESLNAAEVVFLDKPFSENNFSVAQDADVLAVFVNSEVRQKHIDQMLNLKLILTMSTGFDHVDFAYAATKKIAVCNVPAYGSRTVAEFTFALILGLSRKTLHAYRQVKNTHNYNIEELEGFNLQGKTLGIVGTGRIGQNVAAIARGFELNVIAYDAFENPEAAEKYNFKYTSLENLLANSDIVTLHVPYNKDTHHLINKNNISKIKKGALLINTSRGEVLETESLLMAIKEKMISGAGLDVLEGERMLADEIHVLEHTNQEQLKTLIEDHILIDMPEVAYTPHVAFFTKEAKKEIATTTFKNLEAFLKNSPQNLVK